MYTIFLIIIFIDVIYLFIYTYNYILCCTVLLLMYVSCFKPQLRDEKTLKNILLFIHSFDLFWVVIWWSACDSGTSPNICALGQLHWCSLDPPHIGHQSRAEMKITSTPSSSERKRNLSILCTPIWTIWPHMTPLLKHRCIQCYKCRKSLTITFVKWQICLMNHHTMWTKDQFQIWPCRYSLGKQFKL